MPEGTDTSSVHQEERLVSDEDTGASLRSQAEAELDVGDNLHSCDTSGLKYCFPRASMTKDHK